jgi:hypothetical protein
VTTRVRRRVARVRHVDGHEHRIAPGDVYLSHTVLPGDDGAEELTHPWRLAECAACAIRYGRAYLLNLPTDREDPRP